MRNAARILTTALVVLFPTVASAHVGAGDTHGFVHGLMHPLSGVDHVLAMLAVGMIAAHLGRRTLVSLPLTFISVMAVAAMMATAAIGPATIEIGIAVSVIVLGLIVAFRAEPSNVAAIALVGFFALFHGYAHAVDLPETASAIAYGAGFVCAIALLLATGIAVALALDEAKAGYRSRIMQLTGGAMALTGVVFLLGAS